MIHVMWTEPHEELRRDHVGERWCYICRRQEMFDFVVTAPIEPSYYGPRGQIECTHCGTVNGDVFPGRDREAVDV